MLAANVAGMSCRKFCCRWLLALSLPTVFVACASDQKRADAESVANGEALPPAPPVPAHPAATDSPATAPPPVVEAAAAAPASSGAGGGASTSSSADKEALTEAQVALFADLANSSEVEQGKLARTRSKTPSVQKFADMMVKHHTEAQQEQAKLFKKLNLTPAESASAAALRADGEKTTAKLKDASAADFDRVYVATQVEAHQKVLDAIDSKLLPAARGPELEASLRKMRATVEAHLSQAKTLLGPSAS